VSTDLFGAVLPERQPLTARTCQCERPLLSEDTCLRCGRSLTLVGDAGAPAARQEPAWTRASVERAFQAFEFFRGRAPVEADWSRRVNDWPPLEAVEGLFGSVEAAAEAAGLQRSQADDG
jgi:hypothetical protein